MNSTPEPPIIVGHGDDPHVKAVSDVLMARGIKPLVVDLELVMSGGLLISDAGSALHLDGAQIDLGRSRRGWLRRLHRADWGLGVEFGSVDALELGTWHSAYLWLLHAANVSWVTDLQALARAESKLTQWRAAMELGVSYPRTLVTTSSEAVAATFADEVVVKPLGTGQFVSGGEVMTVYAEALMPNDTRLRRLSSVPFVIQERVRASRHYRVVTVGDRLWVAALDVDIIDPTDWRARVENHFAFEEVDDVAPAIIEGASAIAGALGLGYSSQDWIQGQDGETYLVDVNPGGQWLFLPPALGAAVASAIADFLESAA